VAAVSLGLLVACGAPASQGSQGGDPVGAAASGDSAEPFVSTELAWVHPATGMAFPNEVDSFLAVDVASYDELGHNSSVTYINDRDVRVTVYVYPNLRTTLDAATARDREFREVVDTIGMFFDRFEVTAADDVMVEHGGGSEGLVMRGQGYLPDGEQLVRYHTVLMLFTHGDWFIKYRATYPFALREAGMTDFQRLFDALTWPAVPARSGDLA
jgi:hypothetical protein